MNRPADDFSQETDDQRVQQESREIMAMLHDQRDQLSAAQTLPNDETFDQQVLAQAKSRSQEIRDAAALLAMDSQQDRVTPVPMWLKWLWLLAFVALLSLLYLVFGRG